MPDVDQARLATTFLERLDAVAPLLRVWVGNQPLEALFEVRSNETTRVVWGVVPQRTRLAGSNVQRPSVCVAASAEVWDRVLSGALKPGEALGRRELLLRGSASELARLIPLLEMAPPLYRDHVRQYATSEAAVKQRKPTSMGEGCTIRTTRVDRIASHGLNNVAYWMGYSLARLRRRGWSAASITALLESVSRGWERGERS